jgi:quercetin dioxygenase-like cupin family protein
MSSDPALRGYVVSAGEGVPERGADVKASGRSTGGSLTVMEITVDQGPPKHIHTREDESIYVFTGALYVECGADRFEAGPASFIFLPRNLPHTFRSIDGPATGLLMVTPGGLDEYFAELHAVLSSNAGPAEIAAVQERYGIVRA